MRKIGEGQNKDSVEEVLRYARRPDKLQMSAEADDVKQNRTRYICFEVCCLSCHAVVILLCTNIQNEINQIEIELYKILEELKNSVPFHSLRYQLMIMKMLPLHLIQQ